MKPTFFLSIAFFAITACTFNNNKAPFSKNTMEFPERLSSFGLFKGAMSQLLPSDSATVLELSSTLFTDYAEKQRLLKLPRETKLQSTGEGLPVFPEGAILAKTFYYTAGQTQQQQKIIETRILLKNKGKWNVATYQWNDEQTDAFLRHDGAKVPVTIIKPDGKRKEINYKIPTAYDCFDCHRTDNAVMPIGPKLRNLNRYITINGREIPQLTYLSEKGLLDIKGHKNLSSLPAYKDSSLPLEKRTRAYFEINCAHCHNPDGFAGAYSLDLRYETDFENTNIFFNKWNIEHRMSIRDMPRLGTTVIDEQGLELVQQYLATLKK